MKLRLFEVTKKYYVMAADENMAEVIEDMGYEPDVEAHLATTVDDWAWNTQPANAEDERTCGEILQEQNHVDLHRANRQFERMFPNIPSDNT